MPSSVSRRQFIIGAGGAAVGVSVLGLTACGSDDSDSSTTGAGGGSLSTMTVQVSWINDAQNMGIYVARDNGYFAEEGIDLSYLPGGPNVSPEAQLLTGRADIGVTTPDATAAAVATQGAPFKIVGTTFQINPLGIMSLTDKANITSPEEMQGKTIAASQGATAVIQGTLRKLGIDPSSVNIVPHSFDPQVLLADEVDGTAEFCTDTPYIITELGHSPVCTLLADMGYTMYQNTIVVTEETLEERRSDVVGFLRAARKGWVENFEDPAKYPPMFADTWFEGTGSTAEHQTYYNEQQQSLIEGPDGIFTMTPDGVAGVVATLNDAGIDVSEDLFDLTVMQEV